MLGWFVNSDVSDAALAGHLVEEAEVESRPNQVPFSCLDEKVDLNAIRHLFTADALKVLDQVVLAKRNREFGHVHPVRKMRRITLLAATSASYCGTKSVRAFQLGRNVTRNFGIVMFVKNELSAHVTF